MTTFYISPSCLSYKQYKELNVAATAFGWSTPWAWPGRCFQNDVFIDKDIIARALKGIARSDIFIAVIPGTASTNIEIGAAYFKCEELFLVSRTPVHFIQTGLCDVHLAMLPGIKRVCCEIAAIPAELRLEYLQLINAG